MTDRDLFTQAVRNTAAHLGITIESEITLPNQGILVFNLAFGSKRATTAFAEKEIRLTNGVERAVLILETLRKAREEAHG